MSERTMIARRSESAVLLVQPSAGRPGGSRDNTLTDDTDNVIRHNGYQLVFTPSYNTISAKTQIIIGNQPTVHTQMTVFVSYLE